MLKFVFLFAFAVICVKSFAVENVGDAVEDCIIERCNAQYVKCQQTTGCEDKVRKARAKCGDKVNALCYAGIVGYSGPAYDVCICAVNQKCISNGIYSLILKFLSAIQDA